MNVAWCASFCYVAILILISILSLAVIVGLGYLILVVGTNSFSLLFDDTVCTNWIWQTCGSFVHMNDGYSISDIQILAGLINVGLIFLLFIGIISILFTYKQRLHWIWSFFAMYFIWAYLWAWISIFTGKQLAINKFYGCQDYKNYGIILYNLVPNNGWFTLCSKIRNIGPNQGAVQDDNLLGDWNACNKCIILGFWTIYVFALALPLLGLGMYFLVKRYQQRRKITYEVY